MIAVAFIVAIMAVAFVAPAAASAHPSAHPTQDVLTGQVTDAGALPLSHVKVKVMSGTTVVAQAKTDWKGNYWVTLPAGSYDVKFSRYGFETLTTPAVVVSAPSTTLNATLTPLPKLLGQVTDAGALPLKNVKVKVMSGTTVVAQAKTDWKGNYWVTLPAGSYDVKFSRYGFETLTTPAVVVSAPSTTLNATLTPLPKLLGQVTDAGALPLKNVKVKVMSGTTVVAQAKTDWKGNYWVTLPAGSYDVKFSRYGFETLTTPAVVVSAPSTTLNATLTPLPKLLGQVTDAGALPLKNVKVKVMSGTTVVAQAKTDWKGNYWVSLPAGTYDVKFSRYGFETLTTPAVVVSAPSTTLNATLTPLPKLLGQVTDAGALPLKNVKVKVMSGTTVVAQAKTDWKGNYWVTLPAGSYDVKFSRYGFETLTDPAVVVSAPSTTLNATLTAGP